MFFEMNLCVGEGLNGSISPNSSQFCFQNTMSFQNVRIHLTFVTKAVVHDNIINTIWMYSFSIHFDPSQSAVNNHGEEVKYKFSEFDMPENRWIIIKSVSIH